MRKIFISILFIFLLMFNIVNGDTLADTFGDILNEQLELTDIYEMQIIADRINMENNNILPKLNIKEILRSSIYKGSTFSIRELLRGAWPYIMSELMVCIELLGKIIVLAVFCAIFQSLHGSFKNESIGKLAYSICYILIIILAVQSFSIVSKTCIDTIDTIVTFMQSLLPILITLLLSIGAVSSFALFQPIVYTVLTLIATFIKTLVIPMVIFSSILSIISNISDRIKVSKLADLIRETAIALLGITLTVFTGIISIQGLASASIDGVMAKTAKFTVDNFIPIIGDFLSEAFDTVIGCTVLLKNGISIVGLTVLVFITLLPIIKVLGIFLSYKLGAALIQPIIDNELIESLNDISNTIFVLLCCMASVGILFFIAVTIIMGVGNITLMMR